MEDIMQLLTSWFDVRRTFFFENHSSILILKIYSYFHSVITLFRSTMLLSI